MNILLEFTTINYKMWHSLAKRLNEFYPGSKFAGIRGCSPTLRNEQTYFFKAQQDIKYEFLLWNHEIMNEAFEYEIDFEELRKFEEKLPHKSLWRVIAADRGLGHAFMHNVVWPKTVNNTYENILRVFVGLLNKYREIFDRFKPDLFLPAIAMGSVTVFIFEQICKERKIPYLVPSNVRVKNIFAFSSDTQLRFPQIDETYKEIYEGRINIDFSPAQKLYSELMNELENPQYFDRVNSRFDIVRYDSFLKKMRLLASAIKLIIRQTLSLVNMLLRRSNNKGHPGNFTTYFSSISEGIQFLLQKYRISNPNFTEKINYKQKYIYYPLHISPEYSTQVQGTMWLDQLYLIELLAKSIPCDWKVYVKEHPGVLVCRTRSFSFYKKIKNLPNVRLVPIDTDMHQLICNAEMVAVITGTSGWEAIQRGKPVITFADNMWDVLDLSRKCTDVEMLSKDLHDEIHRIKQISHDERKKRIVCLLASMLMHGFNVSYPNQLVYTEPGTDDEYEVLGKEVADALKTHLEYLKIDKGCKLVC